MLYNAYNSQSVIVSDLVLDITFHSVQWLNKPLKKKSYPVSVKMSLYSISITYCFMQLCEKHFVCLAQNIHLNTQIGKQAMHYGTLQSESSQTKMDNLHILGVILWLRKNLNMNQE